MIPAGALHVIDAATVRRLLPMERCIALVRDAMMRLSRGDTRQCLRQVLPLDGDRAFGAMLGAMGGSDVFGAKIIAVDPGNRARGGQSHQGGVLLFDPDDSRPLALVHAGEITAIRTAAASAVASDVLALPGASTLAILGYGEQARAHVEAMRVVRDIRDIRVWGRDIAQARAFARSIAAAHCPATAMSDPVACVAGAEIVCTTTGAAEPLLRAGDIAAGTHLNLVGSSVLGPREIDDDLVVRARFFGDHRPGILAQGAEFAHARAAGLIDERHFLGEIGEVLNGDVAGRTGADAVTIYKSLGHIVQDLASAHAIYRAAVHEGLPAASF